MTVEVRTGTDQTLGKPEVFVKTTEGINSFRALLERISPPNFWNWGGHFEFQSDKARGVIELRLDGMHGETSLHLEMGSTTTEEEVDFALEEPLKEGDEDTNGSFFSFNLVDEDKPAINTQRAWELIGKFKKNLSAELPTIRIVPATSSS